MPLDIKMELHNIPRSKLAEIKATSPMIFCVVTINTLPMTEFLMDNVYVVFGGQLFRQIVGIVMGTICAPLLHDSFSYSFENEFLDKLVKEGKK